jgi:hypothetical protein
MSDDNESDGMNEDGTTEDGDDYVFEPGSDVLVYLPEGGMTVGAYVGMTDYGVILKVTYRMKMVQDRMDIETRNKFKAALWTYTIAGLKELAEENEIAITGLRKKEEIVAEISDVMLAQADAMMEPHEELVPLKRPVMTFLPWQEITRIERAEEHLEEIELTEFSQSLDAFVGITEDEASVSQDEVGVKDE